MGMIVWVIADQDLAEAELAPTIDINRLRRPTF